MSRAKALTSFLTLAAGLAGCAIPGQRTESPVDEKQVRWIIVEASMENIPSGGRWPSGGIKADSQVLAMVAVPDEGMTWVPEIHALDYFVEVLQVDPEGPVGVGQVVTLTVRVGNAKPNAKYRLTAGSTLGDVRIIGRRDAVVWGPESTSFSFTNLKDGAGGLSVAVQAIQ